MKMFFVVFLAIFGMCYSARLDNVYLPPGNSGGPGLRTSGPGIGGGGIRPGPVSGNQPRAQDIPIISYTSENNGDGNYAFGYETGNGISIQERGQSQGNTETVSGSYSYTGPDGLQYTINYSADSNGFRAEGNHLPTPPPIPPEIQRGVELSLAAEARGENQDVGSNGQNRGQGGQGYPSETLGQRGQGIGPVYGAPNNNPYQPNGW